MTKKVREVSEFDFDDEMLYDLLKGCKTQEDLFGEKVVIKNFVKRLSERALKGEMTTHLGYDKHAPDGYNTGNSR